MTRAYYKEAVGAFVVFDISRGSTFDAVLKWKRIWIVKYIFQTAVLIPKVLFQLTNAFCKGQWPDSSQMDQFCKEHGFTGWFETSAR